MSNMQVGSAGDPKLVRDIVERLKREGLFDQFRKECLADVDTKPAYQNLRQRVESYVDNYLSSQKWNKDMNKNQMRDQLRRQIQKAPMFMSGIDRVVDQVVNPKVQKEFKPQIDRMVCEFLGIDPRHREEKQRRIKEALAAKQRLEQQQAMNIQDSVAYQQFQSMSGYQQQPGTNYPPSLLDVTHNLYGYNTSQMGQVSVPNYPPSLLDINPSSFNPQQNFPSVPGYQQQQQQQNFINQALIQNFGIQNYSVQNVPGITNPYAVQMATNIPTSSSLETMVASMATGNMTAMDATQLMYSQMTMPCEEVTMETTMETVIQEEPPKPAEPEKKEKKKKLEPLTVEDLLNIPLPKTEPKKKDPVKKRVKDADASASPASVGEDTGKTPEMIVEEYGGNEMEVVEESTVMEDGQMMMETTVETMQVVDDMHLQGTEGEGQVLEGQEVSISTQPDGTQTVVQVIQEEGAQKKYHFAWEDIDSDRISDVTVSSVHTSDLSDNFSDSDHADHADVSEEEEELAGDTTAETIPAEDQELQKEEVAEGVAEVAYVSEAVVEKAKPRRLIALSYNYSDSEDDESREERKARIAREKEERYLRRQQRRAELEAKRKEKEAERLERARQRKEQQKEQVEQTEQTEQDPTLPEATEGVETEGEEEKAVDKTEEMISEAVSSQDEDKPDKTSTPVSSPVKEMPSSPVKEALMLSPRKRRTKQEMKQQLREQKVEEKRRSLRKQRMRNRKYLSDEFTSIFTENKQLLSDQSYQEELITMEVSVQPDILQSPPTPTQDEQYELDTTETVAVEHGGIPIVEVQATPTGPEGLGSFCHMTRSRVKQSADDTDVSPTGTSDASDKSKAEGVKARGRQKMDETSPDVTTDREGVRSRSRASEARFDEDDGVGMSNEQRSRSQRYDESDLYKPRHNRRRGSSPTDGTAVEAADVTYQSRSKSPLALGRGRKRGRPASPAVDAERREPEDTRETKRSKSDSPIEDTVSRRGRITPVGRGDHMEEEEQERPATPPVSSFRDENILD